MNHSLRHIPVVDLGQVKIGCCGFPLAKEKYAAHFRVVEVQDTFYQPPRVATLERWRTLVPTDFEFTVKAWQLITHGSTSPTYKRVRTPLSPSEKRDCGGFQPTGLVQEGWLATHACAQALSARCVLFQCPASFTPTSRNVGNLRGFFSGLERAGLRLLWEPRGVWPEALIRRLCGELELVHVVDPFLGRTVTGDFLYYRLHGGKDYRHSFTDAELRQLLAVLAPGRPAYVMFNNVTMLEDASRFQQLVRVSL